MGVWYGHLYGMNLWLHISTSAAMLIEAKLKAALDMLALLAEHMPLSMLVMCHRHLQVWDTQARVFADCFADAGLLGLSALAFLIGQAWPCRTSSDPKV